MSKTKKHTFTKADYDKIWATYVEKRMPNLALKGTCGKDEAICPVCEKVMHKNKRITNSAGKADKTYCWDYYIIHDELPADDLDNYQPMHPWCLEQANNLPCLNKRMNQLEGFANPYHSKTNKAAKPSCK